MVYRNALESSAAAPMANSPAEDTGSVSALLRAAQVAPSPVLESINATANAANSLFRSSLTEEQKAYVAARMGSLDPVASSQLALAKIHARQLILERAQQNLKLEELRAQAIAAQLNFPGAGPGLSGLSGLFGSQNPFSAHLGASLFPTEGTLSSLFHANPTQMLAASGTSTLPATAAAGACMEGGKGTFPMKLHQMLSDLEATGRQDIASFLQHGKSFAIHKPREFVRHVMPKYFRMSRFSSFQRQLNLYDFIRVTEGVDRGAYHHHMFLYGQPQLTTGMKRNKIKGVKKAKEEAKAAAAAAAAGRAVSDHEDCSVSSETEAK